MKKAAMFGLCRALRKQSGGLFLAIRHSKASKGANGSFKTNRAAMFGLDARIALAIFGALSVISGAALYSAIQNAKVTQYISYANEVGKAWEQYFLDTGQELGSQNIDPGNSYYYYREVGKLIADTTPGWKGPYLQASVNNWFSLVAPFTTGITVALGFMDDPTGAGVAAVYCLPGEVNCGLWVQFAGPVANVDMSLVKAIDEKIDGAVDGNAGNVMWYGNATYTYFFIKYGPVPKM